MTDTHSTAHSTAVLPEAQALSVFRVGNIEGGKTENKASGTPGYLAIPLPWKGFVPPSVQPRI